MSILRKLFNSVSVVATVVDEDGNILPTKVTCSEMGRNSSWKATREAVVKSNTLKTNCTMDKGTEEERSFRGKDISGKDIAPYIAGANRGETQSKKGTKAEQVKADAEMVAAESAK